MNDRATPIFSWIHVSDIHFDRTTGWLARQRELVTAQLIDDVQRERVERAQPFEALFVTGDVAATGGTVSVDEYEQATHFIESICEAGGVLPENVFIVPGNHDVNRMANHPHVRRLVELLQRGEDRIDDVLEVPADRTLINRRFRGFLSFAMRFGNGDSKLWWDRDVGAPMGRTVTHIRVFGINTAMASIRQAEQGRLPVGLTQFQGLLRGVRERASTITIVLAHHPTFWLSDASQIEPLVEAAADVYICGHTHVASGELAQKSTGAQLLRLQGGAVHAPPDPEPVGYRFGFGHLLENDNGSVDLVSKVRCWSDTHYAFVADRDYHPDGSNSASFRIRAGMARATQSSSGTPASVDVPETLRATIETVADGFATAVGRRRTAYPTDMSFEQLVAHGLFVQPQLSEVVALSPLESTALDVTEVLASLANKRSVLILGEPGSGKSLMHYALLRGASTSARLLLAPLPLEQLLGRAHELPSTAKGLMAEVVRSWGEPTSVVDTVPEDLAFALDGIDEIIAAGASAEEVGRVLQLVCQHFPVVVLCRRYDYEHLLAASASPHLFNEILGMLPWSLAHEFTDFVIRLQRAGLLEDDAILTIVSSDQALRRLVRRPLFARMLTMLYGDKRYPRDETELYANYLQKLSRTLDAAAGFTPGSPAAAGGDCFQLWCSLARHLHARQLFIGSAVQAVQVFEYLRRGGCSESRVWRVTHSLFDVRESVGDVVAEPIHYSFYEFLVAADYASHIRSAVMTGDLDPAVIGTNELTREIRHHLVRLLTRTAPPRLGAWLREIYPVCRGSSDALVELVRANLVVYLLGRVAHELRGALLSILDTEPNLFLRNSIYWAAISQGDDALALRYIRELSKSPGLREINRGYHRYYFGDTPKTDLPPHLDESPRAPWINTRRRLLEFMTTPDGPDFPPVRRAMELFSYADFLQFKRDAATSAERLALEQSLAQVRSACSEDLYGHLREKLRNAFGEASTK